ncbi:hypothetical protein MCAG_03670 [Micromonospora sp. ATCC 39149]|nr:hypothetical protein MCAG_03670 [Micromonospora sp. ATCC 39149]
MATILAASSGPVGPPKLNAPRDTLDTRSPHRPNCRYSTLPSPAVVVAGHPVVRPVLPGAGEWPISMGEPSTARVPRPWY